MFSAYLFSSIVPFGYTTGSQCDFSFMVWSDSVVYLQMFQSGQMMVQMMLGHLTPVEHLCRTRWVRVNWKPCEESVIVGMQLEDIIVTRLPPNTPTVSSCWGLLGSSLTCLGWTINHSYCARSEHVTSSKARLGCLKMARVVRFCCLDCSLLP